MSIWILLDHRRLHIRPASASGEAQREAGRPLAAPALGEMLRWRRCCRALGVSNFQQRKSMAEMILATLFGYIILT